MTIHMIRSDKVYCDLLKMPMAERRPYFKEQVLDLLNQNSTNREFLMRLSRLVVLIS